MGAAGSTDELGWCILESNSLQADAGLHCGGQNVTARAKRRIEDETSVVVVDAA